MSEGIELLLAKARTGEAHEVQTVGKMIASKARDTGRTFDHALVVKAFSGSMSAAQRLHETLLPTWAWAELRLTTRPMAVVGFSGIKAEGQSGTLSRAWLIAILNALNMKQAGERE